MKPQKKGQEHTKYIDHEHLDKIGELAVYYGFRDAKTPDIKKVDFEKCKTLLEGDFIDDSEQATRLPLHVEEKVALLRMYEEQDLLSQPQPVMFYFKEPFKGSIQAPKKQVSYHRYCDLEIIGSSKSVAEALLIQTARMMLKEEGYENVGVEINSIGDKDSITKFTRDLTNHYRKNINDMHPECRQLLKKDPFTLLSCQLDKCKKINERAPKSVTFLSEASRIHFKEILEFLEALEIPYVINNNLIGNRKYCTETMFTLVDLDHGTPGHDQRVLAVGVRYDGLAKRIGAKKEIKVIGLSILIEGKHKELRKEVKKTRRPNVSFVQLGFESKLLSLSVIEALRQVKVPVYQSLAKDRLGAQVSLIEKNHIPYTIIMGKKEAVEKTVIVRDTETHAQETVPLNELSKYMKRLDEKLQK